MRDRNGPDGAGDHAVGKLRTATWTSPSPTRTRRRISRNPVHLAATCFGQLRQNLILCLRAHLLGTASDTGQGYRRRRSATKPEEVTWRDQRRRKATRPAGGRSTFRMYATLYSDVVLPTCDLVEKNIFNTSDMRPFVIHPLSSGGYGVKACLPATGTSSGHRPHGQRTIAPGVLSQGGE